MAWSIRRRLGRPCFKAPILVVSSYKKHRLRTKLIKQSSLSSQPATKSPCIMPSKHRKLEITSSLSQGKATKKVKTTQSTLLPRISEWQGLLPAEPEDQQPTVRTMRSESLSSGISPIPESSGSIVDPSLHGNNKVTEEPSANTVYLQFQLYHLSVRGLLAKLVTPAK